jgi:anti-sigma-K factor RskA
MDRMKDKLDALWAEYREACPDPEPSAQFMPNLWQRIEARRAATTSVFRRLAQVCVAATAALTIIMGVVLIPHLQKAPVYTSNYVDVLAAEHLNSYVDILNGDIR